MKNKELTINILKVWLPIAVTVTLVCGVSYAVVQQSYRMSANDPQIQMAEDAVSLLADGKSPNDLEMGKKVDIAKSLAPYALIADKNGGLIISNGELDGADPKLPKGVFEYAKKHGKEIFTWQPREGVRSAGVLYYYKGKNEGFVFVGRSLREVEKRIDLLTSQVGFGWAFTMFATFIAVSLIEHKTGKKTK